MSTRAAARSVVERLGLRPGTHPENLAAVQMFRAGLHPEQQHRVGAYRLDFAFVGIRVAVEIDGPHHWRPDVAIKDVQRDHWLRTQGWIVFRVTAEDSDQLAEVCRVVHLLLRCGR